LKSSGAIYRTFYKKEGQFFKKRKNGRCPYFLTRKGKEDAQKNNK